MFSRHSLPGIVAVGFFIAVILVFTGLLVAGLVAPGPGAGAGPQGSAPPALDHDPGVVATTLEASPGRAPAIPVRVVPAPVPPDGAPGPAQAVTIPRTLAQAAYTCTGAQGERIWQSHPCTPLPPPPAPATTALQRACQAATHWRSTLGVTRAGYDMISTGGHLEGDWRMDDLTCLLGQPGEQVSAAEYYETYRWRGPQGAVIVLSIYNLGTSGMQILAKAQRGLP